MTETEILIEVPDYITVRELAASMDVSPIDLIKTLMNNGIMANINQQIDFDTAAIVAEEMGFEVIPLVIEPLEAEDELEQPAWRKVLAEEEESDLEPRPAVITMLGHVDHGKTSLLDIIRNTNVQADEAGGITQHIGAYQVKHNGQIVTFLDTPGHEAFTAMRARGAQATDIAILVVAADDGMMPQTYEALDHAKAAKVPIIVAMNKMDLDSANENRMMQQLVEAGITPDEWDGETLVIPVSAKEQLGIDDLLEAIVLTAEEIEPKANPEAAPSGTILDAHLEKGRGVMTTLLVQNGCLNLGDTLLVGDHYGRIKAMDDFTGKKIKSARPSEPVSVSGMNGIPEAGEQFIAVESEKAARRIIDDRKSQITPTYEQAAPISLDEFFSRLQEGEAEILSIILKADVQGSLEPIVNSLEKLSSSEVTLEILRAATGDITENDINLAAASNAVVLGFNVDVDPAAKVAANSLQVEINSYRIIYKLIEDVEKAMKGLLAPEYEDVVIGRAEVREVFRIRSVGAVAGCFMRTGEARRNAKARIIRDAELLYTGEVSSLKHHQENVREIRSGFEFGVSLESWNDFEPADIIEFFVTQRSET